MNIIGLCLIIRTRTEIVCFIRCTAKRKSILYNLTGSTVLYLLYDEHMSILGAKQFIINRAN